MSASSLSKEFLTASATEGAEPSGFCLWDAGESGEIISADVIVLHLIAGAPVAARSVGGIATRNPADYRQAE
jgi:hypothetical protein